MMNRRLSAELSIKSIVKPAEFQGVLKILITTDSACVH